MERIKLIVFDLSGTTVEDDNAVAKCLHQAAIKHDLDVPLEEFQKTIGTNKIHLYQFMIARNKGQDVTIEDFEKYDFPEIYKEAKLIFDTYSKIMLDYYRANVQAMPGAEEVFEWCKQKGIKVATDTGFHSNINEAIINSLGWLERGLIDISVDVENTNGVGRPAPYMIFYAMEKLGIQSVHEVVKIGDTPADLLSGRNAGCKASIGVLSGANNKKTLEDYAPTHIIESVASLPELFRRDAKLKFA